MKECKFCMSQWGSYNALHNHERQCKNNPDTWWTEERRKKSSAIAKKSLKNATYNSAKVCCIVCRREITYKQLNNHYKSKSCGKVKKAGDNKKQKETCKYCGVTPRNTMEYHLGICRKNPNNKKSLEWSEERRKKHSESMKRAVRKNPDSYSKNNVCGRVKIVEYKDGIKLKGSWEVKVAEWLDSQNIIWQNEVNPKPYYWNGDWKLYFPDFYLVEFGCYIEVKGYRTDKDIAKWNYFDCDLLIFEKDAIKIIDEIDIQYALENFIWNKDK